MLRNLLRISTKSMKLSVTNMFYSRFYSVVHAMECEQAFRDEDIEVRTLNSTDHGSVCRLDRPRDDAHSSINRTKTTVKAHMRPTDNLRTDENQFAIERLKKRSDNKGIRAKMSPSRPDADSSGPQGKDLADAVDHLVQRTRHNKASQWIQTNRRSLNSRLQDLLRKPQNGQISLLIDLLHSSTEMPTVKAFNIMIYRLTILRENAAAWTVFHSMLYQGFVPDDYTITSIMNLSVVTGSYSDFRGIIRVVQDINRGNKSRRRNIVLFGAVIKGMVKFGRMKDAELYLKFLRKESLEPNLTILTAMVEGYTKTKDWDKGKTHVRAMVHMEWDAIAVYRMIRFCRACGQPSEVEERIKKLACSKGLASINSTDDPFSLPVGWKTKGLAVRSTNKSPTDQDVAKKNMLQEEDMSQADVSSKVAFQVTDEVKLQAGKESRDKTPKFKDEGD